MSVYERAMDILEKDPTIDSKEYDYFLALTEEQLDELFQYLSEDHERKILEYLERKCHTPTKTKSRPDFIDTVKLAHNRIKFNDPRTQPILKNEGEELQQCLTGRTKKQIAENVYNYPYYEVIRRLLATIVDTQPETDTIKMMHSQLQAMFRQLLNGKLIKGLIDNLSIRRGSYLLDSKPLKGRRKRDKLDLIHFRHYLSEVFEKECRSFQRFMEKTKRATLNVDIEQHLSEVHSVSSFQNRQQDNNNSSSQELSNQEEGTDDIEHNFFLKRTTGMTVDEFQTYSQNRTVNFTAHGIDKLSRFVDSKQTLLHNYKNKDLFKLISYVLCRSLRQIVFRIICSRNAGVLEPIRDFQLTLDEVTKVGNEYIDRIAKRARTYALKFSTYLRKAEELFGKEFEEYGYDKILVPNYMRIKLVKGEKGQVQSLEIWQETWRKSRTSRKLWFERIEGQSQYRIHANKKTMPTKFINEYSEYLFGKQKEIDSMGFAGVFRQYYLSSQQNQPSSTAILPMMNPNQKLDSLFDD